MEITPQKLQVIRSTLNTLVVLVYDLHKKLPNANIEYLDQLEASLLKNLDDLID